MAMVEAIVEAIAGGADPRLGGGTLAKRRSRWSFRAERRTHQLFGHRRIERPAHGLRRDGSRGFGDGDGAFGCAPRARRREGRERGGELTDVRIASLRVLGERLFDHGAEPSGRVGSRFRERRRRRIQDHREELGQARRVEGRHRGEELVEDRAERPDVGARVDVLRRAHLLGRHVERRAEPRRRTRHRRIEDRASSRARGRSSRCRSRAPSRSAFRPVASRGRGSPA